MHRATEASKTIVFMWHKTIQDGFSNHKDGSRLGQPNTIVTYVTIAAVADMTTRDARLTLKNIAHSVGILSGSAHKNLTHQ